MEAFQSWLPCRFSSLLVAICLVVDIHASEPSCPADVDNQQLHPDIPQGYRWNSPDFDHNRAGIAFDGLKRKSDALRSFKAAVRFAREGGDLNGESRSLTNLAVGLMRVGKYRGAMRNLLAAWRVNPSDVQQVDLIRDNLKDLKAIWPKMPPLPAGLEFPAQTTEPHATQAPLRDSNWHRAELTHQRNVARAPPIPRVSVKDIERPENTQFYRLARPFILTDAMKDWPIMSNYTWGSGAEAASLFPKAVVDYYPFNMLEFNTKPFLWRLASVVREFYNPTVHPFPRAAPQEALRSPTSAEGRYLHLQLTMGMWKLLEGQGAMPRKRTKVLKNDWWIRRCLPNQALIDEYHLKTHWKIILIGSRGAGMHNHSDTLLSSSWHAHFSGRKWWYVCGDLPDGSRGVCLEAILEPGEVLYYGKGWHHETQNLVTPTATITNTLVTESNHMALESKLRGTCIRNEVLQDFSAELCDALENCYPLWRERFGGSSASKEPTTWRDFATADEVKIKEARRPQENNYDGRNFIHD